MKKVIHVLNINNFFPELFRITYPTIRAYAEKNGYIINMITERKFPNYPITYEKMQVYEDGKDNQMNVLVDADMLLHPNLPDFETFLSEDAVAFNYGYNISEKYYTNRIKYFVRDGRDVGIATNLVVSSELTHDIWEPLPLTPEQISDLAVPNDEEPNEWNRGWGHYADEFALSYNLAKYGLKYQGVLGSGPQHDYAIHVGTGDKEKSIRIAKETMVKWSKL